MFGIKFTKSPSRAPRPVTSRRLKASERTLIKQQEKFPLLADWIKESQPTAQERVDAFQSGREQQIHLWRQCEAATWKRARRWLRSVPLEQRIEIIADWNNRYYPRSASYFAEFISSRIPGHRQEAVARIEQMVAEMQEAKERQWDAVQKIKVN